MKILYTGKNLRQRRRETILNPPIGIEYISQYPISNMPKDHKLTGTVNNNRTNLYKLILKLIKFLNFPNIRYIQNINKFGKIDKIQTPGQLLLNTKDYFIEIDNVACLGFYNLNSINNILFNFIIKFLLKKDNCKGLICMSEAAKKSVENFFKDDSISKKCYVSYPFVSDKNIKIEELKVNSIKKLLFISSDFYLKGGREVISAFNKINNSNYKLTVITKLDSILEKDLKKYKKIKNLDLIEANLDKDELYNKYYLKSDLFILPTYQDSFGLVFLEALSCGLPIITTNMFATPEMVINNQNGFLLESPVNVFTKNFLFNKKYWNINLSNYIKENPEKFKIIENKLIKLLPIILNDENKLLNMKIESLKLYSSKFKNSIREKHLNKIYLL